MRSTASLVFVAAIAGAGILAGCNRDPEPTVDAGRDLYRQNGCVNCHGPDGRGDGSVADALATRPRDFRDTAAFKQGTHVSAIAKTIATGVTELSQRHWPGEEHHNQVMPQFSHLSDWERRSIALYVISLRDSAGAAVPPR